MRADGSLRPRTIPTLLVATLSLALGTGAARAEPAGWHHDNPIAAYDADIVDGEILVRVRPGVSRAAVDALNRRHGAHVLDVIPQLRVYRLAVPQGRVPEMVDAYRRERVCEYAEPNGIGHAQFVPNDTHFPAQWHLDNTGQTGGTPDADIDAVEGWEISTGDSSIVVAVLDTGIELNQPEFLGRLLPGFDFANNDADPADDHGHGTRVAGILAANADNAFAVAGVDHAVGVLPVKVLRADGTGTTWSLAQGLVFAADQGGDVINMSLGNYPSSLLMLLTDALQYARDAGCILVAAAGNGGIGGADLSLPGVSPLVISVGATDSSDARRATSGTGAALDLVAPGSDIRTVAFGSSADVFASSSGTSAAAPVVAGIATLLLSLDPTLTHEHVLDVLARTAEDQVGPPAEDTPGRDDFFGYGRVNLEQALLAVAQSCTNDLDDDGDGFVDLFDPGCADGTDASEHSAALPCDDGADNDGDGTFDFLAVGLGDPGCASPRSARENPACQDGLDNDNQAGVDFDGGASLDLDQDGFIDPQFDAATPAVGPMDPDCAGKPWKHTEKPSSCGLGFEIVFLAPVLARLTRRRRA